MFFCFLSQKWQLVLFGMLNVNESLVTILQITANYKRQTYYRVAKSYSAQRPTVHDCFCTSVMSSRPPDWPTNHKKAQRWTSNAGVEVWTDDGSWRTADAVNVQYLTCGCRHRWAVARSLHCTRTASAVLVHSPVVFRGRTKQQSSRTTSKTSWEGGIFTTWRGLSRCNNI